MKRIPIHNMPPLEKIELARAANIQAWLTEPYVFFCRRIAPLTTDEAQRLGWDVAFVIAQIREELARSRQLLAAGRPPHYLFGYSPWQHPSCWPTLGVIWCLTLTKSYIFQHHTPDDAIWTAVQHLEAPLEWRRRRRTEEMFAEHFKDQLEKFEPAHLCRTCRNPQSLAEWTNPRAEQEMATQKLKDLLPPFIPRNFTLELRSPTSSR